MADITALPDELAQLSESPVRAQAGSRRFRKHLWIVQRLLLGILTVFIVSLLVFGVTQALPGDPARQILGKDATPESVAALTKTLGLDRPATEQYADWLKGAVVGDFGDSLAARVPVSELLSHRIRNSFVLVFLAAIIAIPLAVISGAVSAFFRDGRADRSMLGLSLGLTAVPEFVVGLVLVIVFATTVTKVLPAVAIFPTDDNPLTHLDLLVLPVITLVLAVWPYLYRLVRASMIDVLESDYVQMAELKGMPSRVVMLRHALPNALVPSIQATAFVLAYLLGGIVVIEYLFTYPGLGSGLIDAVNTRDVPVIQAIIMIFAASYVIFNLIADVLTIYITPRLRTAQG